MSMSSNATSSTSGEPNSEKPKPWSLLLESREELLRLKDLHSSRLWDSLLVLLGAEYHFHLERMLEAEDDSPEARGHKIIAKYLRHFMGAVPSMVEDSLRHAEAHERGEFEHPDTNDGGSPYMEGDGGLGEPRDVD